MLILTLVKISNVPINHWINTVKEGISDQRSAVSCGVRAKWIKFLFDYSTLKRFL